MGAFPNAARTENQDSKNPHQTLGQPGMRQYCLMLLIMIDDEKAKIKQPRQNAACYLAGKLEVPESAREGAGQKARGAEQMGPTPDRRINRVRFGCQYDLLPRSHGGYSIFWIGENRFHLSPYSPSGGGQGLILDVSSFNGEFSPRMSRVVVAFRPGLWCIARLTRPVAEMPASGNTN
jgi:hypothetical protein